jgi:hypothetical protein
MELVLQRLISLHQQVQLRMILLLSRLTEEDLTRWRRKFLQLAEVEVWLDS